MFKQEYEQWMLVGDGGGRRSRGIGFIFALGICDFKKFTSKPIKAPTPTPIENLYTDIPSYEQVCIDC